MLCKKRAELIQKLRATNDLQEQRKIKDEIDKIEELLTLLTYE